MSEFKLEALQIELCKITKRIEALEKEKGRTIDFKILNELLPRIEKLEVSSSIKPEPKQDDSSYIKSEIKWSPPEVKESEFSLERTLQNFLLHKNSYTTDDMVKAIRELAIKKVHECYRHNEKPHADEIIKKLGEL